MALPSRGEMPENGPPAGEYLSGRGNPGKCTPRDPLPEEKEVSTSGDPEVSMSITVGNMLCHKAGGVLTSYSNFQN